MGWEAGLAYRSKVRVNVKVLDFVKRGGLAITVDTVVFEMWLGSLSKHTCLAIPGL